MNRFVSFVFVVVIVGSVIADNWPQWRGPDRDGVWKETGDCVWEDLTAVPGARWSNIHMVKNADKIWMFNERGELLISRLTPAGFEEISRAKLIEPTTGQLKQRDGVCWSHPAYAYKHIYIRNDAELLCASLAAGRGPE